MKTELDDCFEILLDRLYYDGNNLTAELVEQIIGEHRKIEINPASRKFKATFGIVISHLLIEEFAESVANLVQSDEKGFLQKMENRSLVEFLGLNVSERYESLDCYALLTSHEILIVFCENDPIVESIY